MNDFSTDFLQGQQDCKDGRIPRSTADAYNRGYETQKNVGIAKRFSLECEK